MRQTVAGERVCLRALSLADTDALFSYYADPETMRYWAWPAYTERASAEKYIEEAQKSSPEAGYLTWGIARADDDALLGTCALHKIDLSNGRSEIGYLLGRPHWGQGLATEAVACAVDYAFCVLKLRRLEADIDPRNTASQRVLERLGFTQEGYLKERWCVAGEVSDSALFGLLAHDWRTA